MATLKEVLTDPETSDAEKVLLACRLMWEELEGESRLVYRLKLIRSETVLIGLFHDDVVTSRMYKFFAQVVFPWFDGNEDVVSDNPFPEESLQPLYALRSGGKHRAILEEKP